MSRIAARSPSLLARAVLVLGIMAGGVLQCDGDRPALETPEIAPMSAITYFEREDMTLGLNALADLHPIGMRAMSNPSTRILVVGFANERPDLQGNLDLGARRARNVAHQLAAWAVMDRQIVVAAVESAPDDESGARCEISLVDTPRAVVAFAGADGR